MSRTFTIFIICAATFGTVIGVTAGDQPEQVETVITYQYTGDHADPAVTVQHEIGRIENDAYQQALAEAEQERIREQERMVAARRSAGSVVVHTGSCEGIPAWFPAGIAWRESRCSYDAYNPTGCSGYGCVGLYQFDRRHFDGWANGQAACGDLNPSIPAEQDECAWRLSRGGTSYAPWGT